MISVSNFETCSKFRSNLKHVRLLSQQLLHLKRLFLTLRAHDASLQIEWILVGESDSKNENSYRMSRKRSFGSSAYAAQRESAVLLADQHEGGIFDPALLHAGRQLMFRVSVDQVGPVEARGLAQSDEECMNRQEFGRLSASLVAAVTFTDACISQLSGQRELRLFPVPAQGVQCNLQKQTYSSLKLCVCKKGNESSSRKGSPDSGLLCLL